MMVLHDPHADYTNRNDPSTIKVLNAAQLVVTSIHTLSMSSFDISRISNRVILYWLATARILMRWYRTLVLEKEDFEQAYIVGNDIDAIM
jgi:hypothetical protein